jgi:hypothetical protein
MRPLPLRGEGRISPLQKRKSELKSKTVLKWGKPRDTSLLFPIESFGGDEYVSGKELYHEKQWSW